MNIKESNFKKVSFVKNKMTEETRNAHIRNFFSYMNEDLSEIMINAIENTKSIIQPELFENKGMILYICKIYSHNFYSHLIEDFYSNEKFFANLIKLMQLTHNNKYRLEPKTEEFMT